MSRERVVELLADQEHLAQAYKDLWREVDVKVELAFKEGFKRGQKATYLHATYLDSWLKSESRAILKEKQGVYQR